ELLESRHKSAIVSSQSLIAQHLSYKLLDQEMDVTRLPKYFQSIYLECRDRVSQKATNDDGPLIDIGDDGHQVKPLVAADDDASQDCVCDRSTSLDDSRDISSAGRPSCDAATIVATRDDDPVAMNLPPP